MPVGACGLEHPSLARDFENQSSTAQSETAKNGVQRGSMGFKFPSYEPEGGKLTLAHLSGPWPEKKKHAETPLEVELFEGSRP